MEKEPCKCIQPFCWACPDRRVKIHHAMDREKNRPLWPWQCHPERVRWEAGLWFRGTWGSVDDFDGRSLVHWNRLTDFSMSFQVSLRWCLYILQSRATMIDGRQHQHINCRHLLPICTEWWVMLFGNTWCLSNEEMSQGMTILHSKWWAHEDVYIPTRPRNHLKRPARMDVNQVIPSPLRRAHVLPPVGAQVG